VSYSNIIATVSQTIIRSYAVTSNVNELMLLSPRGQGEIPANSAGVGEVHYPLSLGSNNLGDLDSTV